MTDKQVEDINNLIKNCKYRAIYDLCRMIPLPCERVIDKGQCPEIIEYLEADKEISDERDSN